MPGRSRASPYTRAGADLAASPAKSDLEIRRANPANPGISQIELLNTTLGPRMAVYKTTEASKTATAHVGIGSNIRSDERGVVRVKAAVASLVVLGSGIASTLAGLTLSIPSDSALLFIGGAAVSIISFFVLIDAVFAKESSGIPNNPTQVPAPTKVTKPEKFVFPEYKENMWAIRKEIFGEGHGLLLSPKEIGMMRDEINRRSAEYHARRQEAYRAWHAALSPEQRALEDKRVQAADAERVRRAEEYKRNKLRERMDEHRRRTGKYGGGW